MTARYTTLKLGTEVKLKKDERCGDVRFRAGTTGRVGLPKLLNGKVVVDIFLLDKGTKGYEVSRSNLRVVPKPSPKRNPAAVGVSALPKGYDLLTPSERALLSPMAVQRLATALKNQRQAKKAMLEAIQTYADCTANVSHARRIAYKDSGLT